MSTRSLLIRIGLLSFATAAVWAGTPQMTSVAPDFGKIGSILKIKGQFLGKDRVDEVYLTDRTLDLKVKVLEQTDDYIQIRIPPSVKPGKLQFLVKTPGKLPTLIEQPVYIRVEEEGSDISASK